MQKSAEGSEKRSSRSRKYMVFSLGHKRYAVLLSQVKEVIGIPDITPIPNVPAYYVGMFNLRGQIISAVDLREKLHAQTAGNRTRETCVVIFLLGEINVGAIVDEVVEVVTYNSDQIEENSDGDQRASSSDGIYAVAKEANGDLTLLIELEKTFEKTEFKFYNDGDAA